MSTASGPVGVGIIGAGVISAQYLAALVTFPDVVVRFIADIDLDRARARADEFGIAGSGTVDALLAVDDIEIVVNLTIPAVHVEVGERIVAAGKHVWSEKPIGLDRRSVARLLATAHEAGLRVACAPDTVLGAGVQTALRAIAAGEIGTPLSATSMMLGPGPEAWHPAPEFLFAAGGGPLFDMGPYYLTSLVLALGSVDRVAAAASTAFATRTIGSGPRAGTVFPVDVPTYSGALLRFVDGGSAQTTFSFQSALRRSGFLEITGTDGVLSLPDPNTFSGATTLWRRGADEPETIEPIGSAAGRGTGVLDLARAIRSGTAERASGALASHVLDVMLSIEEAAASGEIVSVSTRAPSTAPLDAGWDPTEATLAASGD